MVLNPPVSNKIIIPDNFPVFCSWFFPIFVVKIKKNQLFVKKLITYFATLLSGFNDPLMN